MTAAKRTSLTSPDRRSPAFAALLFAAALTTSLAGCGGGSGGGTPAPAPAAAAVPVAPAPAPAPTITSISPTTLTPPGRVTVTGTNLDRVTQAALGGTTLTIATQSATSLALDVPANAASNFITLTAATGAVQSSQQLVIGSPVTLTSVAPASVLPGATLTVNGTGLDRVTSVEFTGGAAANVASRTGTTALTVTVPTGAASGPVTLVGTGLRVANGTSVTIIPRITVTNATANTAAPGASVTLNGSGFVEVSGVQVGGAAATLTARTATSLTFTVPAGITCGAITLLSASQPSVNGGSVVAASGCALRLDALEYAQVLSQPTSGTYAARLVPGKRTVVRAYVLTTTAGTTSPSVRLTAFNGTTQLGTLDMSGPAALPVVAAGAPVPDTVRYDELQTFNAALPAAWVTSGLRVQVTVDAEQRFGAPVTREETPVVGMPTRIDLVIVPLVANGLAPTIAANTVANALDELSRRMPVARDRITVTLRQPYTLTNSSITGAVDTSAEWSAALSELRTLKNLEGAGKVYYGMVNPGGVTSGIAGIGYVSSTPSASAPLASLGWDTSFGGWRRTFIHELGHNFSRSHAPCGNVSGADPSYPYTGGVMSAAPLFDSLIDDVLSPLGAQGANTRDVMGYCNGSWFSDYNYRAVQLFLEGLPTAATQVQAQAQVQGGKVSVAGEVLVISGSIGLDGLRLAPVQVTTGLADAAAAGEYTLQLQLADGRTIELPFDAELVDHAMPPEKHFLVRVPHPGPLASIDVVRGGAAVPRVDAAQVSAQRAAAQVRASKASTGAAGGMASVSVTESGGVLRVQWDATAYPVLSVTHVGKERRVLAVQLRGGTAQLDIADLPAGGSLEFGLSDGLNVARATSVR